ncbi:hypothetical protein [Streptomyces sp. B4I13]|uniref:hypothetical protein n=1 Tax=Streptomyces sp. B4I13 TaxID=3042271 RepID=UPI0027D7E1F3|nr:hypothetical protein [Streptomyces sp. B4I13]
MDTSTSAAASEARDEGARGLAARQAPARCHGERYLGTDLFHDEWRHHEADHRGKPWTARFTGASLSNTDAGRERGMNMPSPDHVGLQKNIPIPDDRAWVGLDTARMPAGSRTPSPA